MQNAECFSCGCYGLTPADIALKWQTAPPPMPILKDFAFERRRSVTHWAG